MNPSETEPIECIEYSHWGLICGILFLILVVLMIIRETRFNKKSENNKFKDSVFRRNFFWSILWFLLILLGLTTLRLFKVFKFQFTYPFESHIDGIIGLMAIFGIIGAIWAVFARIDAERAFNQSKKTYDALGSTFDFMIILDEHKLPEIINKIGEPKSTISLYIGFPIIGLPYFNNKQLRTQPSEIFRSLLEKISKIKLDIEDKKSMNFFLNIGIINKVESMRLLDDIDNIDNVDKEILKNRLDDFYKNIEYIKNSNNSNIKVLEFELKEKFRFVTYYKIKKQAFVWIVDFKENANKKVGLFDSMVFQTEEDKFVSLLENVFKS